jgi:hypothetical protein
MSRGVLSSFHNVSTYDGQGIEYWTQFLMKIDLIKTNKWREFGHDFTIVGKPLMSKN